MEATSLHRFDPSEAAKLDDPRRAKAYAPERLIADSGLQAEHDVLDLGCGTGFFTIPVARHVRGQVFAVDVSSELLDIVRTRSAEAGLHNVSTMPGDAEQIPLSESSVDRVICSLVLHECADLRKALTEIKRVLRPEGKLLILEWVKKETKLGPPVQHRVDAEELLGLLTGLRYAGEVQYPNSAQYVITADRSLDERDRT